LADLSLRKRTSEVLEAKRRNDPLGLIFDYFLVVLIVLNVIAIMLATVNTIMAEYQHLFFVFEVFSVAVFTIEYGLRVWSSVEITDEQESHWKIRLRYMASPMALIDLAAILPFYLGLFINLDLRFLRVLRLLRVMKLGRYSSAMQLLFDVIKQEYRILLASQFLLIMLMIIAASGIYLIEHQVQPEHFSSIPQSMWWAVVTLTTLGYGDVVPITAIGRFFAGTITILSLAMVALPSGILASSFSEHLRKRRSEFRNKIKHALADGALDMEELDDLESLRKSLDIDVQDAVELFDIVHSHQQQQKPKSCPHCGESLL
jgi:voltage-gated potassium channel